MADGLQHIRPDAARREWSRTRHPRGLRRTNLPWSRTHVPSANSRADSRAWLKSRRDRAVTQQRCACRKPGIRPLGRVQSKSHNAETNHNRDFISMPYPARAVQDGWVAMPPGRTIAKSAMNFLAHAAPNSLLRSSRKLSCGPGLLDSRSDRDCSDLCYAHRRCNEE